MAIQFDINIQMPRRHITNQRITHNGAQRPKLGGGWANAQVDPLQDHLPVDQQGLNQLLIERFEILEACSGQQADFVYLQDRFESILDQLSANDPEDVQYFYHSDHLGSSSFITDASGTVDQHLQYLPFSWRDCADVRSTTQLARPNPDIRLRRIVVDGEPWIDQRTNTGIRFTFSGKEKDEETGYSYFGARYYNADISIWLSVDPLNDERSWLTPYNYCSNNPIKLVDPTGMLDELSNTNGEEGTAGAGNPLASGRSNYLSSLIRSNSPYPNSDSGNELSPLNNPFNEGRDVIIPALEGGSGRYSELIGKKSDTYIHNRVEKVRTHGTYFGISLNFAFIGGFGINTGVVTDSYGERNMYFSFNANIGYGLDASLERGMINPTSRNQRFQSQHLIGKGGAFTLGTNNFGVTYAGSMNENLPKIDKLNPLNFGTTTRGNTGYIMSDINVGTPKFSKGITVGGWVTSSRTWVW